MTSKRRRSNNLPCIGPLKKSVLTCPSLFFNDTLSVCVKFLVIPSFVLFVSFLFFFKVDPWVSLPCKTLDFPHEALISHIWVELPLGLVALRTVPLARCTALWAGTLAAAPGVMRLGSASVEAVQQKKSAPAPDVDSRRLIPNSSAFHAGKCFDFMQISESSPLEVNKKAKSNARWRNNRK